MQLDELHLELVSACNAACSHCTWQKRTTDRAVMSVATACRLIKEAAAMGVRTMNFHGVGEPTLHPYLLEILHFADECLNDFWLSTNCSNLKGELVRPYSGLPGIKNLTLVLAVPWTEDVAFVHRCMMNAIDYMVASRHNGVHNKRIYVQMVCAEGSENHFWRLLGEFMPFVERLEKVYLYLKQPLTWPNMKPIRGFLRRELAGHPKVLFEDVATPRSIAVGCDMPNRFLMVTADETVVPCCVGMDDWGLGKITGRTLASVWASPELTVIRSQWERGDAAVPCGQCKNRSDCV